MIQAISKLSVGLFILFLLSFPISGVQTLFDIKDGSDTSLGLYLVSILIIYIIYLQKQKKGGEKDA